MTTTQVWDAATDTIIEVTTTEAAAGIIRYARSLGAGTAACAVYERRAIEMTR